MEAHLTYVGNSAIHRSDGTMRLNWQFKALLPVAFVLLNGLLLFLLVTLSSEDAQRKVILIVATSGALVTCAALLASLSIVIRRPVVELQEKIRQVRDGDLEATVSFADRKDDIGELGRNFNDMLGQLRSSQNEIERLHRTQMSRAEHLATLGEMAAGLAHEIRNPLAGIAGVMEFVGRDLPESSPAREVVHEVKQEVMHINRIVTDLLETARPKPPEFQMADLNATVEHAIMFARQQAANRPITVEFIRDETLEVVEHDTRQINQVMLNLVLNAIQAIEDKAGKVTVEVGQRGGLAIVSVTDNGKGITAENLAHIFRPFFTTKGHGTGLGLPLARRIAEDHGGRIEVNSQVGVGTTFRLCLPFHRVAKKAKAEPPVQVVV